jgi:hypothetical protein
MKPIEEMNDAELSNFFASGGHSTERSGEAVQRPLRLTELDALAAERGYELQVFTQDGLKFAWRYRGDTDIPTLREAVAMTLRNYADRYFVIQIRPCDMPSEPMTMERWAAAGHTLD